MNLRPNLSKFFAGLLRIAFAFLTVSAAHGQVLLTIDDSIPGATTVTTTGAVPFTDFGPYSSADGVTLISFFTTDFSPYFPPFTVTSTSLTAGTVLGEAVADNLSDTETPVGVVDLSLYNDETPGPLTFTASPTGTPAFNGKLTLALGSYAADLPAVGAHGSIYTSFSVGSADPTYIGEWEVVAAPEPSTCVMLVGGLGLLAFLRRATLKA